MSQIDVFVINLKRSAHRRARMEKQLKACNVRYEFIEAVDGNQLSAGEIAEAQARGSGIMEKFPRRNPLLPGEIGCALSHLQVYEKIVAEDRDYALILEDDLRIEHPHMLRYILQRSHLLDLNTKRPFDFIYLFATLPHSRGWYRLFPWRSPHAKFAQWGKTSLGKGFYLCRPCVHLWGTGAYIVNKRACEVFLKEGLPVRKPADVLTGCAPVFGLRQYFISPLPIGLNEEEQSTIDKACPRHIHPPRPPLYRRLLIALNPARAIHFLLRKAGVISHAHTVREKIYYE